ncbi:hypothetical protein K7432_013567, partial [Basidiobolus ranarum]
MPTNLAPREIHLWFKLMEVFYPPDELLHETLENDFIDKKWIKHRASKKSIIVNHNSYDATAAALLNTERNLIAKYAKKFAFSCSLIHAIGAITYTHPTAVFECWRIVSKIPTRKRILDDHHGALFPEEAKGNMVIIDDLMTQVEAELEKIEQKLPIDQEFREFWEPRTEPIPDPPFPVTNEVDDEPFPHLEFVYQNMTHKSVVEPDQEFAYGCDCEDDCSNIETCTCLEEMGEFPYEDGRLKVAMPIYECNSVCGCDPMKCKNSLIQSSHIHSNLEV